MTDTGLQAYLDMAGTVLVLLASWLMWPVAHRGIVTGHVGGRSA